MKVLYLTSFVLGDAGANAADIFPRLAVQNPEIEQVYVADFPRNKHHIEVRQGARYLRLEWRRTWLRHAARIARKCRSEKIDVIHVFYRQQNAVLLILIRIWLFLLGARTKVLMDHRSVNLAKGWRARRKRALNMAMQTCAHALAGNPWAVETNHIRTFRPKHLIDLGYDNLPNGAAHTPAPPATDVVFWFIGTLKPRNRQSEFLLKVFAAVEKQATSYGKQAKFHVAGPARADQIATLKALSNVTYHGKLPRSDLYRKLLEHPGIGLAYMNHSFHEYAPSLKFAEYAIMRYDILASDTLGLKTQAGRMNLPGRVRFLPERVDAWADAVREMAQSYQGLAPPWDDAPHWSYPSIFARQVLPLYRDLSGHGTALEQEIGFPHIRQGQPFDQQHIAVSEIDPQSGSDIGGHLGHLRETGKATAFAKAD